MEAEAISSVFFPDCGSGVDHQRCKLLVGSIKTIIGHTEGVAGIAGVLKASLALQNRLVPANLHFSRLNPRIEPFYHNLQIVTKTEIWPSVPDTQTLRASVNSFGFGGTNAHCVRSSYLI